MEVRPEQNLILIYFKKKKIFKVLFNNACWLIPIGILKIIS